MISRLWRRICLHIVQVGWNERMHRYGAMRSVKGGGGGGAGGGSDGSVDSKEVHITLQGTRYTREDVRELIEQINETVRDGVTLSVDEPAEEAS